MDFALRWSLERGWPGLFGVLLIGVVLADLFNGHKTLKEALEAKMRDTLLFVTFAGLGMVWGIYLEIANETPERWALPVVFLGSLLVTMLAADWLQYILFAMGVHPSGAPGWLGEKAKTHAATISRWVGRIRAKVSGRARALLARKDDGKVLVLLTLLALAIIACVTISVTPVPTPAELGNQTPTAHGAPPTDVPAPVGTASPSATSSISEVTPAPTGSIIEVGTPLMSTLPPSGVVVFEAGRFTPYGNMNIRACPSMSCDRLGVGIRAGETVNTQGWVYNEDSEIWLCLIAYDDGKAQTCYEAVLWLSPDGKFGKYEVVEE